MLLDDELELDEIGYFVIAEIANDILGYDQVLTRTRVTDFNRIDFNTANVNLEVNELGKTPKQVKVTIVVEDVTE